VSECRGQKNKIMRKKRKIKKERENKQGRGSECREEKNEIMRKKMKNKKERKRRIKGSMGRDQNMFYLLYSSFCNLSQSAEPPSSNDSCAGCRQQLG
jgi:hypothetical protein